MQEGIKYVISADVKQAVSGIKQLEQSLLTVGKGAAIAAGGAALFAAKVVFLEPTLKILDETLGEIKDELINLVDAQRKYNDALQLSVAGTGAATVRIFQLVEAVKSGTLNTNQLASAEKELVKANPAFAGAFVDSKVNVEKLNTALDQTVTKIFNTIKAQAATKILAAEFEKITAQILAEGKNLTTLQRLTAGAGGRFAGGVGNEIAKNNLSAANLALDEFGKRVQEVFDKLKVTFDVTKPFKEPLEKTIKGYRDINDEIVKIGLEEETKFQRDIRNLEEKIRLQEELNRLQKDVLGNIPKQLPGSQLNGNRDLVLRNARSQLDNINDPSLRDATEQLDQIVKKSLDLSNVINNGINSGIDQFFNAIANNQNPFEALIQSVKRLIVELSAAVIKAMILKAITSASGGFGGGAARATKAFGADLQGGSIRELSAARVRLG